MGLSSLLGLKDRINGRSLPAHMNYLEASQKAKRYSDRIDGIIAEAVKEQSVQDEADRQSMLARAYKRMDQHDEPNSERKRRQADKWAEIAIQLERKLT